MKTRLVITRLDLLSKAFEAMTDPPVFQIDPDGLLLREMDHERSAMITLRFWTNAFRSLQRDLVTGDNPERFRIDLESLRRDLAVLHAAGESEVDFIVKRDKYELKGAIADRHGFLVPEERLPLREPELSYSSSATFSGADLYHLIEAIRATEGTRDVRLDLVPAPDCGLRLEAETGTDQVQGRTLIRCTPLGGQSRGPGGAPVNIRRERFLGALAIRMASPVTIHLGPELPVRVAFDILEDDARIGSFSAIVARRTAD